jgi:TPR repeat protein
MASEELRALFEEDQADRRALFEKDQANRRQAIDPEEMISCDAGRLQRLEHLIAEGALRDPDDYFHAAMLLQHGPNRAHYQRAHELAMRAAELGSQPARWLAAAAHDRWLMAVGLPQKYGTQYRAEGDRWVLHEVDPTTSDEERARWDVPPLVEALRRAEEMMRECPPVLPPPIRRPNTA